MSGQTPTATVIPPFTDPVFRGLKEGILVVDDVGMIHEASYAADRIFGYECGEMVGCSIEMLIPAQKREAHVHHRSTYAESPSVREMGSGLELMGVRSDGTSFHVDVSLSPC